MNMPRMISAWMTAAAVTVTVLISSRPGFGRGGGRRRCPGREDPQFGREDHGDDAIPRLQQPLDQARSQRGQRHGGRHRWQADLDQCPHGHLRQPALRREQPIERQAAGAGRGGQPGHRPGRDPAGGRVVLRQADADDTHRGTPRGQGDACWSTAFPREARRSRSPRGSSRGSSSPPTTRMPRASASRSTPRSTRATAAARR